jgi:copper chaperone
MTTSTTTYTVAGMTCGHCVSAVTEEVSKIPGVVEVRIDLSSGALEVAGSSPVDDDAVEEAVHEAGYELVSV